MIAAGHVDAIPALLRQHAQWVVWRYEPRPGETKPTKVPYSTRTGRRASTTDPSTWASFEEALAAAGN